MESVCIPFSVLNNLSNISFDSEYAALCGITKEEVLRDFKPEINKLEQVRDGLSMKP